MSIVPAKLRITTYGGDPCEEAREMLLKGGRLDYDDKSLWTVTYKDASIRWLVVDIEVLPSAVFRIDWKLFAHQLGTLARLANTHPDEAIQDHLSGLCNLLSELKDEAVNLWEEDEDTIFIPLDKEDEIPDVEDAINHVI